MKHQSVRAGFFVEAIAIKRKEEVF